MRQEYNTLLEVKKILKSHISFFESLLKHLKGHDKISREGAVWTAWCLNRYIHEKLIYDIGEAKRNYSRKETENVQ